MIAASAVGPLCAHGEEAPTTSRNFGDANIGAFTEPGRDIPLHDDADVIVCGAGPAGVAAAIGAAKSGARVRLMELHGCLGGVWTAGLLTWIYEFQRPGLTHEIHRKLGERGARHPKGWGNFVYDPEAMKLLLEELCSEAEVKIRLQTRVVGAYRDGRRLTTIVTESRSGREAWRAPVFIDCTGDGDLGALAGNGYDMGVLIDGQVVCQPWTMNAVAIVKDVERIKDYILFYDATGFSPNPINAFRSEINRAGLTPSYGQPTLFHLRGNLVLVMANHEYGVRPDNADDFTKATINARKEILSIVRGLDKLGGPWEGMRIAATAEQIGIREGRRLHGLYTVTKDDITNGARQEDAVERASFPVDIHALSKKINDEQGAIQAMHVKPYDIPLRALIAKDVDGLMMAGRCISGDFYAHASYRQTGNAVHMGEAAGVVAAVAAETKRLPHEIPWSVVAPKLEHSRKAK